MSQAESEKPLSIIHSIKAQDPHRVIIVIVLEDLEFTIRNDPNVGNIADLWSDFAEKGKLRMKEIGAKTGSICPFSVSSGTSFILLVAGAPSVAPTTRRSSRNKPKVTESIGVQWPNIDKGLRESAEALWRYVGKSTECHLYSTEETFWFASERCDRSHV